MKIPFHVHLKIGPWDLVLGTLADGDVLTYNATNKTFRNQTLAGAGVAPSSADYLVGTAQSGLSAEIVVGTTPGGELGNTWPSPTVDTTHSGSSHASLPTQAANLDMGNNLVLNIGAAGTDFTAGGGLTLAGTQTDNDVLMVRGGASTPPAGSGLELLYAGGVGYLRSYNRTGGAYLQLNINDIITIAAANASVAVAAPLTVILGSATASAQPVVAANVQTSATGVGNTADTNDDTLFTYSLPSNSMSGNGKSVRVLASGHFATTANAKRVKLWFAGAVIADSGAVTLSNVDWRADMEVTRIDATHVSCVGTFMGSNVAAVVTVTPNQAVSDLTANASIVKVSGSSTIAGAANDILGYLMRTDFGN